MSDEEDIPDINEQVIDSESEDEVMSTEDLNSLEEEENEEESDEEDIVPTKINNPCEHFVEENFKKFTTELDRDLIINLHPREKAINYDEVKKLCSIQRTKDGIIYDPLHITIPILTKFEYTRVLGLRATQIENNSPLFIKIDDSIIDSYIIARKELEAKKLPFIICRPLPGGKIEYWDINDLENLNS
jgi:DNA-directed RNA polymerase subunit K/omega